MSSFGIHLKINVRCQILYNIGYKMKCWIISMCVVVSKFSSMYFNHVKLQRNRMIVERVHFSFKYKLPKAPERLIMIIYPGDREKRLPAVLFSSERAREPHSWSRALASVSRFFIHTLNSARAEEAGVAQSPSLRRRVY